MFKSIKNFINEVLSRLTFIEKLCYDIKMKCLEETKYFRVVERQESYLKAMRENIQGINTRLSAIEVEMILLRGGTPPIKEKDGISKDQ